MSDNFRVSELAGRLAALPHVASPVLRAREAADLATAIPSALAELRRQAVVEAVRAHGRHGAIGVVAEQLGIHRNKVAELLHQNPAEK